MKIRLSEIRTIVRSVITEASRGGPGIHVAGGGDWIITDPDGVDYKGMRTRIRQALIRSTNMTGDERNDTMNTGRASAAAISALKRAGVIKRVSPPKRPVSSPRRDFDKRGRQDSPSGQAKAGREYAKAVKDFAKSWENPENTSTRRAERATPRRVSSGHTRRSGPCGRGSWTSERATCMRT